MSAKPFSHKALRDIGYAKGSSLLLFTDPSYSTADHVICSNDDMLLKLVPDLSSATFQLLDAASETIALRHPQTHDASIIMSYEGSVSDFVQRLGRPLMVKTNEQEAPPKSISPDQIIPLPPEFEQALKHLLDSKRKVMQLFEDGSFKIG